MISRHLGLVRRAGWSVVDQVLSALTNAVLAMVVARTVGQAEFGAFSACFLLFSLGIGIQRALVGQPTGIRYTDVEAPAHRSGLARGLGTTLAVGLTLGTVLAVAGGLFTRSGAQVGPTLLATGAMLPALLLQDGVRMAFFAQRRPGLAALNDALWAVVQFSAIGALIVTDAVSTPRLVLAWGGAAAVCVVVGLAQLRVLPRLRGALSWLREHRDLWGYLLAQYLLGVGSFQGGVLVVGAIIGGSQGLTLIGAIRAAQVAIGPLSILATAVNTFALPELSRRHWLTTAQLWRVALGIGGLMAGVCLLYTGMIVVLPPSLGETLFGDSWQDARYALVPLALGAAMGGLCQGAALVVYALGQARRTFRLMLVEAPLVFTLMLTGGLLAGARGAAWGMFLDLALLVPLWFWTLSDVLRRHAAGEPGVAIGTVPLATPARLGGRT